MTWEDVLKVVAGIVVSLGGGGVIVAGLSSWLGKVWADRLMQRERATYEQQLEQLRSRLSLSNDREINKLKQELEVQRHTQIQEYQDKLAIYRMVADIVAKLLSDLDELEAEGRLPDGHEKEFNRERMSAYGYLAMLAPQDVMDSYDNLIDYLLDATTGHKAYDWLLIRSLVLNLVNGIRVDIGLNKTPIEYRGKN